MTWKTIKDFTNYEVSTNGEVRNKKSGNTLKPREQANGYLLVSLYVNGKVTQKYVHRIVAETFIQNPENKEQVNHLNECKSDNRADNLGWTTAQENSNYGTRNDRVAVALSKPIIVLYRDDIYEEYPSATVAARELGVSRQSIVDVLKGRSKIHHDYVFKYAV
ncbi:NUMOD4 domain-containing protein [Leuconostoc citreum]|uniref:NUMOD4 domain-containing protein n=1 Tax=Leuconostoc citreum TaxID=33964 RepID=UPI0012BA45BA|nr:NUMOD4 domain-containing protein [Leuconostoc citreum]QGN59904.1 hypothetical protein GJ636_00120 [Leuconostoc citreum]QGN59946.1 hypothetical protein GJ636_00350 [Leuconostoc citreum]